MCMWLWKTTKKSHPNCKTIDKQIEINFCERKENKKIKIKKEDELFETTKVIAQNKANKIQQQKKGIKIAKLRIQY